MERKQPLRRRAPLRARTPLSPGKKGLKRTAQLRNAERAVERLLERKREPGRDLWKTTRYGRCAVCGRYGLLFRHHVLLEQLVRRHGGDPNDLRNALDLGAYCDCHDRHHQGRDARGVDIRIPYAVLVRKAPKAIAFAREVLGEGPAAMYFWRRYRDAPDPIDRREQHPCRPQPTRSAT